ncbi:putative xanthine/uracil permease [Tolypocladium ophioglossoides CBS 100239]|uniref:Putative xanthine/uracil permease n=1 Tax=Tolypocladium ophioglossoides (strain CBS 100239) TaxID=1163406 RepID=A0A0L0NEQ0_TOLOC|nr:putative xanthine/uracil permease [Tolypocladium ophioglossoides CBS 100239]
MGFIHNTNVRVAKSPVGRWFRLDGSGHPKERKGSYFFTEIRAGLASFFAMAYIIAVNSAIVADSGGTCVCPHTAEDPFCDKDQDYLLCLQGIKRDAVTATAAISALASFCMGLFANLPVGLAPGMGLNAYFAYTVVGRHGTGLVPYQVALTAILVEGFIFLGLAVFGMRQWLARAIPHSIKIATGVGIGLFLTVIGLTYSEGIGLIVGATATPTELAGCSPENLLADGTCPSWDKMRHPAMWVGIFCGGILTVLLTMYRVKGAIIIGIILVSAISWPRGTPVTYFPYTSVGNDAFDFFKHVVSFHRIENILNVLQWNVSEYGGQFGLALITFLYVDILDCTGTLYGMARFASLIDPVTQDFEGSSVAYMVDAISISIGAILGVPPVTAFVESGAGISEGGKTGMTAMVTGICFFISVFFAPIFASIPPWATGCVLILVGSMMASAVTEINWKYMGDAVPAFLAIALMPFTFSIANGLIGGVCSYILINTVVWLVKLASRGRVVPPNIDEKEHWTWRIPGGFFPPWMVRLFKGKKDFWREDYPVETPVREPKLSADQDGTSDSGRPMETVPVKG